MAIPRITFFFFFFNLYISRLKHCFSLRSPKINKANLHPVAKEGVLTSEEYQQGFNSQSSYSIECIWLNTFKIRAILYYYN